MCACARVYARVLDTVGRPDGAGAVSGPVRAPPGRWDLSVLQSPPKANDSSTQALGSGEGVCFPWASSMVHPTKTAPGAPSWSLATRPPRALNPVPSLPLGQAAGSQEATTFPESHPHPPCLLSLFPQQLDWPHSLARAVSVNQFQTSRAAFPWPREGCVGGSLFLSRAFSS